jgi:hypothetical protein
VHIIESDSKKCLDYLETVAGVCQENGVAPGLEVVVSSDDPFPVPLLRSSELTSIMYGCIEAEHRSSYIMHNPSHHHQVCMGIVPSAMCLHSLGVHHRPWDVVSHDSPTAPTDYLAEQRIMVQRRTDSCMGRMWERLFAQNLTMFSTGRTRRFCQIGGVAYTPMSKVWMMSNDDVLPGNCRSRHVLQGHERDHHIHRHMAAECSSSSIPTCAACAHWGPSAHFAVAPCGTNNPHPRTGRAVRYTQGVQDLWRYPLGKGGKYQSRVCYDRPRARREQTPHSRAPRFSGSSVFGRRAHAHTGTGAAFAPGGVCDGRSPRRRSGTAVRRRPCADNPCSGAAPDDTFP